MNATAKQIEFIKSLCAQTGYDPDEYNFATHDREHTLTAIKWCELFYALKEEKRDNLQGN